jgi:hypothetical protein
VKTQELNDVMFGINEARTKVFIRTSGLLSKKLMNYEQR